MIALNIKTFSLTLRNNEKYNHGINSYNNSCVKVILKGLVYTDRQSHNYVPGDVL